MRIVPALHLSRNLLVARPSTRRGMKKPDNGKQTNHDYLTTHFVNRRVFVSLAK